MTPVKIKEIKDQLFRDLTEIEQRLAEFETENQYLPSVGVATPLPDEICDSQTC